MNDKTTGAMQKFGVPSQRGGMIAASSAGVVLLYAEGYENLPGAWALDEDEIVIGREAVDIVLDVNAVSRRHAAITHSNEAYAIRDLGSRNGTLVDGRPVEACLLEHGSEIRVGDAILKFVDEDAEEYARFRIDGETLEPGRRCRRQTTLVGGFQMDRIAAEIERIAPAELTVMLLGESGTGKEVVARELHDASQRSGRFCAINCAAIPAQLIESELFGYKRGAFSGADRDKPGLIRTANEGTLLLDEIGDMPLEAQAKLLRVLQSKEVFPLGATTPERVDVRIVCATHRDLSRLQQSGAFREDLFARLNEYQVRLPPLRERKEDIFMLSRAFLERQGRPELVPSFKFMTGLLHYDWPYNVRELEAAIKRCVALSDGMVLGEAQLPDSVRDAMADYGKRGGTGGRPSAPPGSGITTPSRSSIPSDIELRALLEQHRGNIAAVGRELGKARMQIHRWMKRYGIEVDDYRE
jgi:transcriptional regulator with PAS, ATPase and Fis domain